MSGASPLLAGKLTAPPLPGTTVPRPRLLRLLDGALTTPVTVLTAGPGWGKTTLLAQWSARLPERPGWVRLGAGDDDPARFWRYVATALAPAVPDAAARAVAALAVPQVDPVDVAVPELLNGLAARTEPCVLVLDDHHVLTDPAVRAGLEFFVEYLPPALHVVLAGRSEPPLPTARLRARRQLTELGVDDLRFGAEETRALLRALSGRDLGGERLADLSTETEGWAAGLVLGALAERTRGPGRAERSSRTAADYLLAEVVHGQPPARRDFLLRTAPLRRLSGPLCDHVLETTGSAATLADLERTGMFATALDDDRDWYRYHPLFRAALLRELADPDRAAALQRRAAGWYAGRGLVEDAVRALADAGDRAEAARTLSAGTAAFISAGTVGTFLRLGEQLLPADGELLLSLAWAAGVTGRRERAGALLDLAEAQLPAGYPGFRSAAGACAAIRAVYGISAGSPADAALHASARAVTEETDPALPGWVVARVASGGALLAHGRAPEAVPVLESAWTAPVVQQLPPFSRLEVAGLLAWACTQVGGHGRASRVLHTVSAEARAVEEALGDAAAPAVALLRAAEGLVALDAGRPAEGRAALARAAELVRIDAHPAVAVLVLVSAAEVELEHGGPRTAWGVLDQAREALGAVPPMPGLLARLTGLEARAGRVAATRTRPQLLGEQLTDRELSVLRALRGPLDQRGIGAELGLTRNTVKGYVTALYRKLDVASRAEAVERGRHLGLC